MLPDITSKGARLQDHLRALPPLVRLGALGSVRQRGAGRACDRAGAVYLNAKCLSLILDERHQCCRHLSVAIRRL